MRRAAWTNRASARLPTLYSRYASGLPRLLVGVGGTGLQDPGSIRRFCSAASGWGRSWGGWLPWPVVPRCDVSSDRGGYRLGSIAAPGMTRLVEFTDNPRRAPVAEGSLFLSSSTLTPFEEK